MYFRTLIETTRAVGVESAMETLDHGCLTPVGDWGDNPMLYLARDYVQEGLALHKKEIRA
jgi:hypothetical protein